MKMPLVMCAVCLKPVDRVEVFDDVRSYDKVFRVYCHGDMEEARLGVRDLMHKPGIVSATAFGTMKIEKGSG